jgi:hypothetical protein
VSHLTYVVAIGEDFLEGELGSTLEELSLSAVFFYFALHAGRTITVLTYALTHLPPLDMVYRCLYRSDESWPFNLITKCGTIRTVKEQLSKLQPSSDLLVSGLKSTRPRLLVVLNSEPKTERPEDLIRMLLTGAATERFANRFLVTFIAKDCAFRHIYLGGWQSISLFVVSGAEQPSGMLDSVM